MQGHGIGSQMLAVYCEQLDLAGGSGYLETDKIENVRLYERFGFEVRSEAHVLGVPNWFMWRKPTRWSPVATEPQSIDRAVARGGRDPGPGVVGDSALRPGADRLDERLLDRVLGQIEVAEDPDQGRDRPSPLLPEEPLDDLARRGRYGIRGLPSSSNCMTGRISTEPPRSGIRDAAAIASSRSLHSSR